VVRSERELPTNRPRHVEGRGFLCGLYDSVYFGWALLECFRVRAAHDWASKLPSAIVVLTKIDGRRRVACLSGYCHTLRRMSGAWFVRVGWIPASGSDVLPCMPLQLRPKND
jgi:hypothetical protein